MKYAAIIIVLLLGECSDDVTRLERKPLAADPDWVPMTRDPEPVPRLYPQAVKADRLPIRSLEPTPVQTEVVTKPAELAPLPNLPAPPK